jgi:hypothetical protein
MLKKKPKKEQTKEDSEYFLTLQINARLMPLDRGDIYEDPILDALEASGCGTVDGGGTLLQKAGGEIEYCDVGIVLNGNTKENMDELLRIIDSIEFPKGSFLIGEDLKLPLGVLEGLALYMNGTELPDEVYRSHDINYVIERIKELLGESGSLYSYWEGPKDTALYFYGPSFEEMKKKMDAFISVCPLCQKSRVEKIA